MKLSEAILLSIGAIRNEPLQFFNPNGYRSKPGACGCAIGTALYSMGLRVQSRKLPGYENIWCQQAYWELMKQYWPWLHDELISEISCRHTAGESRESIAKWIATIEPEEAGIADNINLTEQQTDSTPGLTSLGVECQG